MIEGAYTISEPKLIMPKARTAQGTWVAVLSIENHLKSYTDQEVDKDKSILETTLAYDPDSESWIWDGPSLSIVTIAASETSTTPENPDIPKTENLDGKDTGNKDTSDKATGNAGTSSSGSEQRSDKKGSGSSSSNKVNTAMNSQISILSLVTAGAAMMTSLLSLLHFRKEYDE